MKYGFLIDQRKCIGCHACTVACKAENHVPVGSFRTWVKYTEKGTFPSVRRHFTVLRCNHCDNAPCVTICPVKALHKRPDAIVDLDRDQCIGCVACMQACPYDALYLNEDTGTAEKCHFCAHRVELDLEPACVVVCPEEAIVCGDVDNPESRIANTLRDQETSQRKLEKGTQPKLWYVDALEASLQPGSAREPEAWLWSDRRQAPVAVPGFEALPDLVTTFNVDHSRRWGWHIYGYLMTKNLAAGTMLLAPWCTLAGYDGGLFPEIAALFFLAITSFLLVHDLGKPERFLKILLRPNLKSWLVLGTYFLIGFGALTSASLVARLAGWPEVANGLRWLNLPFALMTSGYSAFLFAQCKGRDLWLEKGLFATLILRAVLLGGAVATFFPQSPDRDQSWPLAGLTCFLAGLLVVWQEIRHRKQSPESENGRRAHRLMFERLAHAKTDFMLLMAAVLGGAAAFSTAPMFTFGLMILPLAAVALLLLEKAWIEAGQEVPLS
ncbi:MAG: 4Fe-4S dicluster domain-containing protein [Planctomycetota bacterium]|nr:MAG: 4Fe-4S dicluster domain-containing protein [Planctomycetota bacterium]